MGNERSSEYLATPENNNRLIFISYESYRNWPAESYKSRFNSFTFIVKYQRYYWTISKRFSEIVTLDSQLLKKFPEKLDRIKCPRKYRKLFWSHTDELLTRRARDIVAYLQRILDDDEIFHSDIVREFLEIGQTSLNPHLGRKGKEGFLQKCSGGYLENYSSRAGDFIKTWQTRWFVLHDNFIAYYKTRGDVIPQGTLHIDQKFQVTITGRVVTVSNRSRKLSLFAPTMKSAIEWAESLNQFYHLCPKRLPQPFSGHFPPRPNAGIKLFCCGKEYFSALAVALLRAQEEIFIASWMVSPTLLLTRPPLAPIRLDQILRFKAEQGVKIYVLLYKEVEMSGTGNDSLKCRVYLESLHPTNIMALRHPNKLIGGSTAILWSHHEKLVIIDRKIGFVGGIDPCYGRWDDDRHRLSDEDGVLFPGKDYYQPARGLFRPVQDLEVMEQNDQDDDLGEFVLDDEPVEPNANDDNMSEADFYCPSEVAEDEHIGESPLSDQSFIGEEKPNRRKLLSSLSQKSLRSKTGLTDAEMVALKDLEPPSNKFDLSVFEEEDENIGTGSLKPAANQSSTSLTSTNPTPAPTPTPVQNPDYLPEPPSPPSQVRFSVQASRIETISEVEPQPTQSLSPQNSSSSLPPKQFQVVGQVLPSNSIVKGVILPEAPQLTADALAANSIQYGDADVPQSPPKPSDLQSSSSSTLFAAKSTENRSREYSLALPFRSIVESIQSISEGMTNKRPEKRKVDEINIRDLYPRMPWHDVHGCMTGLPVRDLAAHFIQRWNHHRVSKSAHDSRPILTDITDNPYYSVCARCNLTNIFETATQCPNCNYDLGPINIPLSLTMTEFPVLKSPQEHVSSYLTYECYFSGQLGCRIQGDGPSLVTLIINPETVQKIIEGSIIESIGEEDHLQLLKGKGFRPIVGDVLVAIEDVTVLHLNSIEVQRFIKRQKQKVKRVLQREFSNGSTVSDSVSVSSHRSVMERKLKVVFRRHYVDNVDEILKHDQKVTAYLRERASKEKNSTFDLNESKSGKDPQTESKENEIKSLEEGDPTLSSSTSTFAQFFSSKPEEKWDHQSTRIDLVCRASTSREVCKAMMDAEKQIQSRGDVLPPVGCFPGTCQIQVLRSVGPWSLGQSAETSIHSAWVQTIQQAQHFIYIENQFFIGDLAGTDVKNSIARAILDRVVQAAQRREAFKAIIIVPVHPEGDYVGSSGPLGVMNYQYKTISRGGSSFFEQFQKQTRGQINPLDYFCFCALRNWGELGGKLVLDQIYVHDKLLIVDDRIMIMGSANVNDRSMLGERDTEVAIRIEDTTHYMGKMGGKPWVVGAAPHMFRKRLMGKHIGDYRCDMTDPISDDVYRLKWLSIARENTSLYNELDGPCSYDKCNTLEEYAKAILERPFLNSNDPLVESFLARIKGHLVMFPLRFLFKENLKSLAHSTVLPDELFA